MGLLTRLPPLCHGIKQVQAQRPIKLKGQTRAGGGRRAASGGGPAVGPSDIHDIARHPTYLRAPCARCRKREQGVSVVGALGATPSSTGKQLDALQLTWPAP